MQTRSLIRVFLGVATLVVMWNFAAGQPYRPTPPTGGPACVAR